MEQYQWADIDRDNRKNKTGPPAHFQRAPAAALEFAEAQLELLRIRSTRTALIAKIEFVETDKQELRWLLAPLRTLRTHQAATGVGKALRCRRSKDAGVC
jgi:hypothetical protein